MNFFRIHTADFILYSVVPRFKHKGNNFHIKLPSPNVSISEELVQIQAYLRWERNGKQIYTPEQEKARKKFLLLSCYIFLVAIFHQNISMSVFNHA